MVKRASAFVRHQQPSLVPCLLMINLRWPQYIYCLYLHFDQTVQESAWMYTSLSHFVIVFSLVYSSALTVKFLVVWSIMPSVNIRKMLLYRSRNHASVWSCKHHQVDRCLSVISDVHRYGVGWVWRGLFIDLTSSLCTISGTNVFIIGAWPNWSNSEQWATCTEANTGCVHMLPVEHTVLITCFHPSSNCT